MQSVISAAGLVRHLDGRATAPQTLKFDNSKKAWVKPDGSAATTAEVEAFHAATDEWRQKEDIVKSQIFCTIYSSLHIRVRRLATAHDVWTAICTVEESKSELYQLDVRRQIMNLQVKDDSKMRDHLNELRKLRETLLSMGADFSDPEFSSAIVATLPESY